MGTLLFERITHFLGVKKKLILKNLFLYYASTNQHTHKQTMSTTQEILAERVAVLEKQVALLLSEKAVDVSETKPVKNDDDKPKKKRTSGYILYSNAHRDEVKETMTEGDEKPKNTDIMKKLAENWKLLSDDEREKWNTKAKELRAEQSD